MVLRLRFLRLVLVIALAGCHRPDAAEPLPLPSVRVQTVAWTTVTSHVSVAGVLAPLPGRDVKVGALVQGRVEQLFVAEGDVVRVGQPLAHIEAQPLKDRVIASTANGADAEAQLTNARTRLGRSTKLWKDGIAPRQEVDDAEAQVVAAQAGVARAHAEGGSASVQLDHATLRAPIAGVVAAILVPAGQPVEGNSTPVVEIADTRELDLRAALPASVIGGVRLGDAAQLEADGQISIQGQVAAISPMVDVTTNTVVVRIRVANRDGRLRGGLFVRGAIAGPAHRGIVLPRAALLPGDGGAASQVALVSPDGKVSHRTVQVVAEEGERVELAGGVASGERVIVSGGYALPDEQRVDVAP